MHPNTFRYRLRRISEISGLDLANFRARLAALIQLDGYPPDTRLTAGSHGAATSGGPGTHRRIRRIALVIFGDRHMAAQHPRRDTDLQRDEKGPAPAARPAVAAPVTLPRGASDPARIDSDASRREIPPGTGVVMKSRRILGVAGRPGRAPAGRLLRERWIGLGLQRRQTPVRGRGHVRRAAGLHADVHLPAVHGANGNDDVTYLQPLMWLPLYWVGRPRRRAGHDRLQLSMADPTVFSTAAGPSR